MRRCGGGLDDTLCGGVYPCCWVPGQEDAGVNGERIIIIILCKYILQSCKVHDWRRGVSHGNKVVRDSRPEEKAGEWTTVKLSISHF